jgi:hypothetical protein
MASVHTLISSLYSILYMYLYWFLYFLSLLIEKGNPSRFIKKKYRGLVRFFLETCPLPCLRWRHLRGCAGRGFEPPPAGCNHAPLATRPLACPPGLVRSWIRGTRVSARDLTQEEWSVPLPLHSGNVIVSATRKVDRALGKASPSCGGSGPMRTRGRCQTLDTSGKI